jgi:outer membrane lipoprotein SlyB
MKKIFAGLAIFFSLFVTGCATYTGWQPVVDPRTDPNHAMIQQDMSECKMLAQQAGGAGSEAAKSTIAGGLLGAAAGAAIGAVTGNPGAGAAIGAASGGIGGGSYGGLGGDEAYKRAFVNCMRNRGHTVIN